VQKIGRYEIVTELGRGAMGVVYSAMDPLIGRRVAIKTIRLDTMEAPEYREELTRRLFREAQSAGVLSHPGIITIHDVGQQGNEAYIVMEYVDGRNLEDVLATGVPQHSGTLLSILRQSATALDYAHSKGIIHRDIKPANIMLCHDGVSKIADFGVAKLAASASMTQAGLVLGTPSYMSPEQAQGQTVDARSDQFSLAVVAYRMLTGELPFQGATLTAILTKILLEEPQYDGSGLHPYLQIIFQRALAKNPQSRFPNCTDFVRDLEDAYSRCKADMAGKPASAGRESKPAAANAAALAENRPLPASIPVSVDTATIAKEGISRPASADVPSSETPAAAEKKSSASDASVPMPKRKSKGTAWAASLAVIALAVIAFFAIKAIQKPPLQKTPAEGAYSKAADATGSRAPQNQGAGTGESKPAPGLPSQPKPEEGKAASAKAGSSEAGGAIPGTAAPSKPKRSAAALKSPKFESGIITWSGQLEKNAVLVLAPPKASVGSVTGELPGKPVSIEVEPKEVIIRQRPNEANGYKILMLQSGSNRFTSITIYWKTIP
jgi:eukaryotic-like serine/threonine-protein kinase